MGILRPASSARSLRVLVCAAGLCAATFAAQSASADAPAAADLNARSEAIRAFGSRAEGSAGEAAAFDYIERSLRALGLRPATSGFSDAGEDFSTSRIVEARLRGARADELAVVVPVSSWLDSPDPAEGAYGIALALCEAQRLSESANAGRIGSISLRFVFIGAEKRGRMEEGEVAALGSRTWLARQAGRARFAVLYLNAGVAPTRIDLRSAGRSVLSPYWYYEATRRALDRSGIDYGLEANRFQAYRLGLASDYGPAAPYLEAGIPAIELRGESGTGASTPVAAYWLAAFLDDFAKAQTGGFAESWDRHYFIFQFGKFSFALREKAYVAFLVVLLALVVSSFLIATVARRGASKQLLKRAPAFLAEVLALFAALAVVFLAGKGLARLDSYVLGSLDAWRLAPRLFASARILFSFLLFLSLLSLLVEKRALTPNPYFYELAALLCLAVDLLVFSVADLSASFYFMWAFILVEISLAVRRRWVTLMAYALMYVPLLIVAGELAAKPDFPSYQRLLSPDFLGVLSLSALTLPFFVFTASPLLFFAPSGAAARKKAGIAFALCALAVEVLTLAFAMSGLPRAGPGRADLAIAETIDQDSGSFTVELKGLRRLGKGSIDRDGTRLEYDSTGDRFVFEGPDDRTRIRLAEKASPFLDRVDESLGLSFVEPPYRVDIVLESPSDILIYDCSLPFRVAVDGRSAIIYAGVNPGTYLHLSLTVASSFSSKLLVTASYLGSLSAYSQSSLSPLGDSGLRVTASFGIGSRPR